MTWQRRSFAGGMLNVQQEMTLRGNSTRSLALETSPALYGMEPRNRRIIEEKG